MSTYNNEAGRLLDLFERAFAVQGAEQAWLVWAKLLNIRLTGARLDDNLPPICKQLVLMGDVLDSVETDIREQETAEESELYLRHFPNLRLFCCPVGLNGQWNECWKRLSQPALDTLKICAIKLPKETEIPTEELNEIARQIDELIASVRDSQLNKILKTWLLDQLFILRRGLERFWITGRRGLREALARIAGEIVLDRKAYEDVETGDPGIFKRFACLVEGTFSFASKTNTIYTFLEHAHTTIPAAIEFSTKLIT